MLQIVFVSCQFLALCSFCGKFTVLVSQFSILDDADHTMVIVGFNWSMLLVDWLIAMT